MLAKFLYDILIGAPVALAREMLEAIRDEVDKERLITEESIKERLQQLQLMLEDGEITEEEYQELEDQLLRRLRMVREYQREREGR